jgi:hypothetical protein
MDNSDSEASNGESVSPASLVSHAPILSRASGRFLLLLSLRDLLLQDPGVRSIKQRLMKFTSSIMCERFDIEDTLCVFMPEWIVKRGSALVPRNHVWITKWK